MEKFKNKYIGDRQFYMYVLGIAIPMIIQNLITNFVSMLDNIMVGRLGTTQMSGVSIVNQFMFVFNITIFGGVSGASIFGTQFFGKGDHEGQKYTVRFRVIMALIIILISGGILNFCGSDLISLFLSKDDSPEIIAETLKYGEQYLSIMIWSMIPFGIGQVYSSVVRECGETRIPMYGSMAAIGVNLCLDYGLIFGKAGLPKMGVLGAAVATLIAKTIEALVVIIWAHTHHDKNKYIVGLYKDLYIPSNLVKQMIIKGSPLLVNEFLWSMGMSVIAQCYSVISIDVVGARNIASTITNLFSVIFIQLGGSIGIIVGAKLGAGLLEEARDTDNKLIFFSIVSTVVVSIFLLPVAKFYPQIYKTDEHVKALASYFIIIQAISMPIWSYTNACYFTLRSGGKTGITFLFDFVFTWFVMIPLAFVLTRYTNMEIHLLFAVVTFSEIIKVLVGHFMIKSDIWINNLVDNADDR